MCIRDSDNIETKSDKSGLFEKAIVGQNGKNVLFLNFKVHKLYLKRLQKHVTVVLFQKGLKKTPIIGEMAIF